MPYDIQKFRLVNCGTSGRTAYCRHCKFSLDDCKDKNVVQRAKKHAYDNKHTVDIYCEKHTQYTCYVKELKKTN